MNGVRAQWGDRWGVHLETRADDHIRGRLQLYMGRESPLVVDMVKGAFVCDVPDDRDPREGRPRRGD